MALAVAMIPITSLAAKPEYAVVMVPVADVWSEPASDPAKLTADKRETQILFGEKVLIHESSGSWVRIEAIEQPEFTHHNKWEGYPGWVLNDSLATSQGEKAGVRGASDGRSHVNVAWAPLWDRAADPYGQGLIPLRLPLGSQIAPSAAFDRWLVLTVSGKTLSTDKRYVRDPAVIPKDRRQAILSTADQLQGTAYMWGGLTPENQPPSPSESKGIKYGIDCSGLVHLAFRVNGIQLPRDSHEQWMKAKPIKRNELRPADLIFSAKAENPKKITHVALYAGAGQIIEAPQTGMAVRKISFKEKYGKALEEVESGDRAGERILYFGSFLH